VRVHCARPHNPPLQIERRKVARLSWELEFPIPSQKHLHIEGYHKEALPEAVRGLDRGWCGQGITPRLILIGVFHALGSGWDPSWCVFDLSV
jgi:hypothetical protein